MTDMNIDALLDTNLDDIADLPSWEAFPAGAHRCTLAFEKKQIGDHPAVEAKLAAIETLELAKPADTSPLKAGDSTGVSFMLDNEFGLGKLKALLVPHAEFAGSTKLGEIMDRLDNCEVVVVTKQRANKDKTQYYTDIVKMELV